MSLLRKLQIFTSDVAKLWNIDVANTARTIGTVVGAVQNIDATGKVSPAGEAVGNAPFVKITDGVDTASVIQTNGEMGLVTITPGHVCTNNSTSVTLGINGVFTGVSADVINHGVIVVTVKSSHVSATNGLSVQFSTNGTDWDSTDEYTIAANTGKTFSFQTSARYYRVIYTNGAVAQTYFRLQSILKPYYIKPSSHRIGDTISQEDDAELVKSVLTAKRTVDNLFVPINASNSGNLQITDAENGLAIASGEVTGTTFQHKYGKSFDFDTGDGIVTLWDGAEDGEAWEQMVYQYSTTADIDSISSSELADTEIIIIVGQTVDGTEVSQSATLNGRTRVALTTPLYRVYRAYNSSGTALTGHIIIYVNTAITNGIPDNNTKIRAIIHPTYEQTEMCVYTIPLGYTGYLVNFYASVAGASKTSNYIINLKTRENGKVFRVKHSDAIGDAGTSRFQHHYTIPQILLERTDIEITAEITGTGVTGASISGGFEIVLVAN